MHRGAMMVDFHSKGFASNGLEEIEETEGLGLEFHGLTVFLPPGDHTDPVEPLEDSTFLVLRIPKAGDLHGVSDAIFAGFDLLFDVIESGCFAVFVQNGLDALLDIPILASLEHSVANLIDGSDKRDRRDGKNGQGEQDLKKSHSSRRWQQ